MPSRAKHELLNLLAIMTGRVVQLDRLFSDPMSAETVASAREKIASLKSAMTRMEATLKALSAESKKNESDQKKS